MPRFSLALRVLAFALLGSCTTTTTEFAGLDLGSILVSPDPVNLAPLDSVQLTVAPLDNDGHLVTGVAVTFESSDSSRVRVSVTGMVASVGPLGQATISVAAGDVVESITVTVVSPPASLVVQPNDTTVVPGTSYQLRTSVFDGLGSLLPNHPVTYLSQTTSVATVTSSGLVTSTGQGGESFIEVRATGLLGAAFVRVRVPDSNLVAHVLVPGEPHDVKRAPNGTMYIANLSGSVDRLNPATRQVTGSVATGGLPIRLAFNAASTRALASDVVGTRIFDINLGTNTLTGQLNVTGTPAPMLLSADGARLYVGTNLPRLYRLDAANGAKQDSVSLPATSHRMLWHPNDTLFYVATRDGGTVLEVNAFTMAVARTFTLGGRTQGMAIAGGELYVADEFGGVRIITLATGATAGTISTGGGLGAGTFDIVLSADSSRLYASTMDGRVAVANRTTRAVLRTVFVGGVSRGITFDPVSNLAVVANEAGWVDFVR